MNDILLKGILLYEFLNNLDVQSDFEKKFVTKKLASTTILILGML